MSDQPFLFDDFFVDERDPGVELPVPFKGRIVPLRVKRSITLKEKQAVMEGSIQRHVTDDGKVVIDGLDDAGLTAGLLAAYVISWPFTRDGAPVPITVENVARLDSFFVEAALVELKRKMEAREAEADGPFAAASDEGSAAPAPAASLLGASASVSAATSDSAGSPTPSDA